MPNISVSVINASTAVTDEECAALTAALQIQVSRDFAPAWGTDATLVFVPKTGTPAPGTWWLSILDRTDRLGVAGHHETTSEGLPLAKCFAATDKMFGLKWTVTASHELLEMLSDPYINLTVFVHPEPGKGTLYAYEICDACEDDSFSYDINGIAVCDFVYPAYFEAARAPNSARFDHRNKLTGPVPALLKGGYINSFDLTDLTKGWHPVSAAEIPHGPTDRSHMTERSTSRRERRARARSEWRHSTAFPS